ncbi:hypothetical protein ACIQCN_00600 [Pseudarthrobacter sp. NPDC092424]|uniref:hypothetical protein n=1 Tax=Pseudarthrobacter sp. NPDC092424 TaxID=3364415 RepID=UPI00381D06C4
MGEARINTRGSGSSRTAGRELRARLGPWFLAWLAFLPYAIIRSENLAESDTFWQVRTGLWTMAEGRLPLVDPFSWTAAGKPWTLNSWAFNVLVGLGYEAAGLAGVAFIAACLVAAIGGLVLYLARELGAAPLPSAVVLLAGAPLLMLYLSARPQLVDYLAVLALAVLLRRLLDGHRPGWLLLAVGVLTVLWVNLHAAALLGVAIAGTSGLLALLGTRTRRQAGWLFAAALVISVSAVVTPYGTGLLVQTVQVKAESADITEWQPLNPADPLQLVLFAIGLAGLAFAAKRRDPVLCGALAISAAGSVAAMRILPILVLLALPVMASAMSRGAVLRYLDSRRRMISTGAVALLTFVIGSAIINLPYFGRPDPALFPAAAVKAIPSGCTLFNDYHLGGLVILQRPDVAVSIDSRNDLYGAEAVRQSARVASGRGELDQEFAAAHCVLVHPHGGLAQRLRNSSDWIVTATEPAAVLFVRR